MRLPSYPATLGLILAAGLVARIGYVLAQPASDPAYARPILDGAYYLDWARRLAAGEEGPEGAYYLAPLYPHLLAVFLKVSGESFGLLYLLQHSLVLLVAWALATVARRAAGDAAGLATAAIVLLSRPLLFFASRPVGEAMALALLAGGLLLATGERAFGKGGAGLATGLAALARPNLLLVAAVWAVREAAAHRGRAAGLLLAGTALAVAPAAARNLAASGHCVLVSSNGGITLYHGNGPGALGVFTPAAGLSGRLDTQRTEATALARARTGREMDPVEADRWWGKEALGARLGDPAGTIALLGRRLLLLVDNREHGLDYSPSLDANPWRWAAPAPFALVLALAAVGVTFVGFRGSGGPEVWGAVAACAIMPVAFYASSRYRLPAAVLLSVPAGVGAAFLGRLMATWRDRSRIARAASAGLVSALLSLLAPFGDLERSEQAVALSNLAEVARKAGDLGQSTRMAREAVGRDAACAPCWYNLGVVFEARGRQKEAETAYRRSLALDPGRTEAAGNLAALLIRDGRAADAVPFLRKAIGKRPADRPCWTNLVVALASSGDLEGARRSMQEAASAGVELEPGLLRDLGADAPPPR